MNTLDAAHIVQALLVRHGLADEPVQNLADMLARCEEQVFTDGAELCREKSKGQSMWFLLDGSVAVTRRNYDGTPHHLADVHAPAMLGHMAVIDGAPRSATVAALGQARVAALPKASFDDLVGDEGPSGDLLRRLLIASLNEQLGRGNIALQNVVDGEEVELDPETQEIADHEVLKASASFDGWI